MNMASMQSTAEAANPFGKAFIVRKADGEIVATVDFNEKIAKGKKFNSTIQGMCMRCRDTKSFKVDLTGLATVLSAEDRHEIFQYRYGEPPLEVMI